MNPFVHLFLAGFFSVIPMLIYLVIIWLMDRYEREPFWLVGLNFLWGATGAIIFGIIGSIIMGIGVTQFIYQFATDSNVREFNNIAGAVVVAPLVEESTKGIFLLIMALSKNFDGPVDGAVYGGAIGLGFGMTENFLYFMSYGSSMGSLLQLIVIRTLFSAVLHCLCQATFGAAIGFAKFKGFGWKILIIPTGLAIAMFMHFTWNLTVSFNQTALLGFVFLFMALVIIFTIFQFGVYSDHKMILRELTDESNSGFLPREHVNYIPYTSRRFKAGWFPDRGRQKEYVRTAVKLAYRKYQVKNLRPNAQRSYLRDIEILRGKISQLLMSTKV